MLEFKSGKLSRRMDLIRIRRAKHEVGEHLSPPAAANRGGWPFLGLFSEVLAASAEHEYRAEHRHHAEQRAEAGEDSSAAIAILIDDVADVIC